MEEKKEFKLDTSFDLLKTDGLKLNVDKEEKKEEKVLDTKLEDTKVSNMKDIFATANDSVKKATEIFNKNIELKKKLEEKFELLNKEKRDLEIKNNEFRLHKEELNKQVELWKQKQTEFEMYKITENKKIEEKMSNIEKRETELKSDRELLESQRKVLELDRTKCEMDKEELTSNLNKFNELVGEFSIGIDKFNKIEEGNL